MILKKTYLLLVILCCFLSANAQFTLKASGGNMNYQWYKVDNTSIMQIVGANADSFLATVPGIFYATFDGTTCGKNASEYFVLTANGDTNLVLNANQPGAGFQWYKNNIQISGATSNALNIISSDTLQYYQAEVSTANCNKQLPGFYVYHLGVWAPLPLELISFDAFVIEDKTKVLLDWKTTSEINTSHFTVERSTDKSNWEFVDKVAAAGNTTVLLTYQTYDNKPYKGFSYYRLKITDLDNSFSYSEVRSVFIGTPNVDYVRIYPNPFNNVIIIEGPEEEFENLKIYNSIGQMVRKIPFKELFVSPNKKEIDVSELAIGVYFIHTKTTQTKILKQD